MKTDTKKQGGSDSLHEPVRQSDVEYRWYGHGALSKRWIPSCWARPTMKEAMALLENDRFCGSGMLKTPLKLVRETKTFTEVADVSNDLNNQR